MFNITLSSNRIKFINKIIKEAENYRDLIDETIKGEVDVALISPLAFILAKEENPQLDLLAAVVAQGTTTYSGYLVTPSQSDIFSINDAQGKKLALVDPVSTSGSLFPLLFFQQQGINIDNYFAKTGRNLNLGAKLDSAKPRCGAVQI